MDNRLHLVASPCLPFTGVFFFFDLLAFAGVTGRRAHNFEIPLSKAIYLILSPTGITCQVLAFWICAQVILFMRSI